MNQPETETPVNGGDEDVQEEDVQEPAKSRGGVVLERGLQLVLLLAVVAFVALAVAGVFEVWPDKVPQGSEPSWIDNIFASKTVVFGARVVLFSAAVVLFVGAAYIVVSIVYRVRSREWLRKMGPFEVSEQAISALKGQIEELQLAASGAEQEINSLRANLTETQGVAEHFYQLWADEVGLALADHEGQ